MRPVARLQPSTIPLYPYAVAAALPILLLLVGAAGYRFIEGWSVPDVFYMAVITLTTVGFDEVHPLSPAGRTFTMFYSMGGIFVLFYATASIIGAVVRGDLLDLLGSRRMEHQLSHLKDHVIVCGVGRMGRLICQQFSMQRVEFVVIDRDATALDAFDMPYGIPLHGDAASDDVLKRAGVERAKALVSVVASDSDNLYITMSARLASSRLFIIARAEDARSEEKLLRAGASRVVSPYVVGGHHVVQALLRPNVLDFLELATRSEHLELNVEETEVAAASKLAGATIQSSRLRDEHGVIVVAIKRRAGSMVFNPPSSAKLEEGDILIMLGERPALDRVARLAQG